MDETKKKFPLSIFEIVLLVITIPIVFYYLEKLLWTFGESGERHWWSSWFLSGIGYLLEKPWNPWGPLSILGLDCIWMIVMRYVPLKNLRVKIYLTLLIFTISAAILTMWLMGNLARGWTS